MIALTEVADLLVCPRCGAPLHTPESDATYRCTGERCVFAAGFPAVADRWPVLLDPGASVVDPALIPAPPSIDVTATDGRRLRARVTGRLRALVRPTNAVATTQLARLADELPTGALVLVIGGGSVGNGTEAFLADPRLRVLAFDIYPSAHVQLLADAHAIPLRDGAVHAVVIQAVLEHVLDPARVVAEIHRVLRPDGLVYAETPFMQQVHAGPYDFTRFTDSGHRWLFRRFAELDRGVVAGAGTTMSWSIDHLVRSMTGSRLAGRLARLLLFWVRFADRFGDERAARDGASAVFFLGRRSEREVTPREIIAAYRGAQAAPATVDGAGTPTAE